MPAASACGCDITHQPLPSDAHLSHDFALISFEYDGTARELLSIEDARRAVADHTITPDTELTFYAPDGSIRVDRADRFALFTALFAADSVEEQAIEPVEMQAAPDPLVDAATPAPIDYVLRFTSPYANCRSGQIARWCVHPDEPFAVGDVVCVLQTERAFVRFLAPGAGILRRKLVRAQNSVAVGTPLAMLSLDWRAESDLPPQVHYFDQGSATPDTPTHAIDHGGPSAIAAVSDAPPPRRRGCGAYLIVIIIVLAALVFAKNALLSEGQDKARNAALPVDTAAIGEPDFRPPGDVVSRFLVRRADVLARPELLAERLSSLERGGSINGIFIRDPDGVDWLWLADGEGKGGFVLASNLAQRSPPPLLDQRERGAKLVADAPVFAWPDNASSAQVDGDGAAILIPSGEVVTVTGSTQSEFYEITLSPRQGGGVGYIARAAIDGGLVAAPSDSLLDRGIASASSALKNTAKVALNGTSAPALKVTNGCKTTATVLFYYRGEAGFTHHNGASWDYRSGDSGYPTLPNGDRLYPVNGEVYYAAAPIGQGPLRQGSYDKSVIVNGQEYHFRRAKLETLANGDYTFRLRC